MSIVQYLKTHEDTGALRRVWPPKGHAAKRGAFLTALAQRAVDDGNSAINVLGLRPYVQVALERWVIGAPMRVRLSGTKPGASLARLDPAEGEIWEFRITEPVNQVRVFFRFARPDFIIVTGMNTKRLLGGKTSNEWRNAMAQCAAEWDKYFTGLEPHSGETVHDYVTANVRDINARA